MKQRILAGTLLAATIAGGSGAWGAAVESPGAAMAGGPARGPCREMAQSDHLDRMAKLLGLSGTQQQQINDILAAEHENNDALMEKLGECRRQLRTAEQAATFDEAAVRTIAARQAQTEIELTVSRVRVRNRINAVLTTEQRALEQKLHPPMGPGPDHPPPFHDGQ